MRIAMLGTRGVPARYGGFETAIEEIGQRLVARGHEVVVYCRGAEEPKPDELPGDAAGPPAGRPHEGRSRRSATPRCRRCTC